MLYASDERYHQYIKPNIICTAIGFFGVLKYFTNRVGMQRLVRMEN